MARPHDRAIDEWLVVRCQEGSPQALDLLVRRWQRPLWQFARRHVGGEDAAWDVMQEAWLGILRQLRRLDDPAWFAAWAYRIVRNRCAEHYRRAGRRRRLVEALAERRRTSAAAPADGADDPARENPGAAVADALRRLPSEQRELLSLKYREELNIIEIAFVLGIPAGTVKSRLHAAREELRRILEGDEP